MFYLFTLSGRLSFSDTTTLTQKRLPQVPLSHVSSAVCFILLFACCAQMDMGGGGGQLSERGRKESADETIMST